MMRGISSPIPPPVRPTGSVSSAREARHPFATPSGRDGVHFGNSLPLLSLHALDRMTREVEQLFQRASYLSTPQVSDFMEPSQDNEGSIAATVELQGRPFTVLFYWQPDLPLTPDPATGIYQGARYCHLKDVNGGVNLKIRAFNLPAETTIGRYQPSNAAEPAETPLTDPDLTRAIGKLSRSLYMLMLKTADFDIRPTQYRDYLENGYDEARR